MAGLYNDIYDNGEMTVWIDMSTYCNAACPECHRTNPNGLNKVDWLPLIQWSVEDFKKMFPIETMEKINKFDFCGTFGDPLMTKDIDEILRYIGKNSNSHVQIHTNGSLRTEDWFWKIANLYGSRLEIIFAIEGVDQKQHSHYRQGTDLLTILGNMEAASDSDAYITVFCVVHEHNRKSMYDIAVMCRDAGARSIYFTPSNRFVDEIDGKFKFIKNGEVQYLYKPDIDFNDPILNRGVNLGNDKQIEELKKFQ